MRVERLLLQGEVKPPPPGSKGYQEEFNLEANDIQSNLGETLSAILSDGQVEGDW